jgi:hypothetical protein
VSTPRRLIRLSPSIPFHSNAGPAGGRKAMSDATIIEIRGQAAGIVARTSRGFVFYAAQAPFFSLERQHFRSARHAERAARDLLDRRGRPAQPAHA